MRRGQRKTRSAAHKQFLMELLDDAAERLSSEGVPSILDDMRTKIRDYQRVIKELQYLLASTPCGKAEVASHIRAKGYCAECHRLIERCTCCSDESDADESEGDGNEGEGNEGDANEGDGNKSDEIEAEGSEAA